MFETIQELDDQSNNTKMDDQILIFWGELPFKIIDCYSLALEQLVL